MKKKTSLKKKTYSEEIYKCNIMNWNWIDSIEYIFLFILIDKKDSNIMLDKFNNHFCNTKIKYYYIDIDNK